MEREHQHLRSLRAIYASNVRKLEEQAALYGMNMPLNIANELEDYQLKIREIDKVLSPPPRTLSREILETMDPVDRHIYTITLWIETIADVAALRTDVARRSRAQLAAFALLSAATVVAQRPGLSWHLLLFMVVLLGVLGYVAYDIYKTSKR